jgi:general stress protein YciG
MANYNDNDMTRKQRDGQQGGEDNADTQDKEFYQEIGRQRGESQGENSKDKIRQDGQMDQDDMDEESR